MKNMKNMKKKKVALITIAQKLGISDARPIKRRVEKQHKVTKEFWEEKHHTADFIYVTEEEMKKLKERIEADFTHRSPNGTRKKNPCKLPEPMKGEVAVLDLADKYGVSKKVMMRMIKSKEIKKFIRGITVEKGGKLKGLVQTVGYAYIKEQDFIKAFGKPRPKQEPISEKELDKLLA